MDSMLKLMTNQMITLSLEQQEFKRETTSKRHTFVI